MATEHQNRLQEHLRERSEQGQTAIERCCEWTEESIRENPMTATMLMFAAGVGIGALIGSSLAEPMGYHRRQSTAEALGRRMLDSISDVLPQSVKSHLHI